MEIPRTPIEGSSNLVSHGYDQETQTLHIEFKGGKVGEYTGVPADKAQEFADHCSDAGKSAGSFFHSQIRSGGYGFRYV